MKLNLTKITTHPTHALPIPQFTRTFFNILVNEVEVEFDKNHNSPTTSPAQPPIYSYIAYFFLGFALVEVDKNQSTHALPTF